VLVGRPGRPFALCERTDLATMRHAWRLLCLSIRGCAKAGKITHHRLTDRRPPSGDAETVPAPRRLADRRPAQHVTLTQTRARDQKNNSCGCVGSSGFTLLEHYYRVFKLRRPCDHHDAALDPGRLRDTRPPSRAEARVAARHGPTIGSYGGRLGRDARPPLVPPPLMLYLREHQDPLLQRDRYTVPITRTSQRPSVIAISLRPSRGTAKFFRSAPPDSSARPATRSADGGITPPTAMQSIADDTTSGRPPGHDRHRE